MTSSALTSIDGPTPVARAERTPASAAIAATAPVAHCPWRMPICSGGVSGVPQPDMRPHHACRVNSDAGASVNGTPAPERLDGDQRRTRVSGDRRGRHPVAPDDVGTPFHEHHVGPPPSPPQEVACTGRGRGDARLRPRRGTRPVRRSPRPGRRATPPTSDAARCPPEVPASPRRHPGRAATSPRMTSRCRATPPGTRSPSSVAHAYRAASDCRVSWNSAIVSSMICATGFTSSIRPAT